jgi:CHAD domain-containing protein
LGWVLEREVKLAAGPGFHLPELGDVGDGIKAAPVEEVRLETVYWDTPDLNLARWGFSLRHRSGEGWTVKVPSDGKQGPLLERTELTFNGSVRRPPAAAQALLRAYVRSSQLEPVARLSTLRQRIRLEDGRGRKRLEVTDDEVSVLEGRRVAARFRELEVEVAEGGDDYLEPVLERLWAAGAGAAEQVPKNVRALGPRAEMPPEVAVSAADGASTSGDALKSIIAASVAQLLRHDPGIRVGSDPESVHQARVAVRRLRSHLRIFGDLLDPDWTRALRDELGWLGAELGAARDAEVLFERLKGRFGQLPAADHRAARALLATLEAQAVEARERVRATLDSERYIALLDRQVMAAQEPPLLEVASLPAADVLPGLAGRAWRKLKKAIDALGPDSPDADLHRARIAAKQARYASEAVAAIGFADAQAFAKAAAALQTVLGEHQDAVTAQGWLRSAARSRRRAFVAGELCALEAAAANKTRKEWPAVWKDLNRKRLLRWIPAHTG